MEIDLKNTKGEVVRSVELRDDVFDVPMNPALIHQVMVAQLANRRQGTAKTKTRANVSGGGAKPRPQKYTGRARQGSIRSPQWKGGGIVFGPLPRSYNQKTPKRVKRQSIKIMLSDKARSGQLVVLENLDLEQAKTKEMAKVFNALEAERSVLLVADGASEMVIRTARNIPKVKTSPASLLNAVDLLNARRVVMTLDAVRRAEELWGGPFVRRKNGTIIIESEEATVEDAIVEEAAVVESADDAAESEAEPVEAVSDEPVEEESESVEIAEEEPIVAEDSSEQATDEEEDSTEETRE